MTLQIFFSEQKGKIAHVTLLQVMFVVILLYWKTLIHEYYASATSIREVL